MKKGRVILIAVLALIALASCVPGPSQLTNSANTSGVIAGFWYGLWNGVISPVTFVISLFTPSIQMYEVHNNGNWYNFGFLLGIAFIFGGGAGGASSRRWRR